MKMTIRFLQSRNGNLRYRRKIPEHLRPYFGGKREITHALGLTVAQQHLAPARVAAIDSKIRKQLAAAERAYQLDQAPEKLALAAEAWARENRLIGPDPVARYSDPYEVTEYDTWADEIERLAERNTPPGIEPGPEFLPPLERMKLETVKRSRRVEVATGLLSAELAYTQHRHGGTLPKAESVAIAQLKEWLTTRGSSLALADVSRADAREFATYLARDRGQGAETVKRRLNSIRALWNFAIDHFELDLKNPWAGLEVPGTSRAHGAAKASEQRLPFNKRHLKLIDEHIRRTLGSNTTTGHFSTADIMLLLRASGCRPLEVGGLLRGDVQVIDGEHCLIIRPNRLRGLKTAESERIVPIVCPEARLALARVLGAAGNDPEAPLFSATLANTNALSGRLRTWLRAAGVPSSPRLVPYSLRHTLVEALRVSGAPEAITASVVGHAQGTMTARYGSGASTIAQLAAAIRNALPHLGEVPDHIYRAIER